MFILIFIGIYRDIYIYMFLYIVIYNDIFYNSLYQDGDHPDLNPMFLPDMYEYLHYINIGKSMSTVMSSLALAAGGRSRRAILHLVL